MHDPRPLSQRFDLTYVHQRHWPFNWIKPLSVLIPLLVGLYLAFAAVRNDYRTHSPGPVIHAHAMFEHDCGACHQRDLERSGYWLPARDDACLACHIAAAHLEPYGKRFTGEAMPVHDYLGEVTMSRDCAACHIEHRGRGYDLSELDDRFCVQCHRDLGGYAETRWPVDHLTDNAITAFADDHPPFDVLAGEPIDTTPLKFEHATHMNPATGGMQDDIRRWIASLDEAGVPRQQIAVAQLGPPDAPDAPRGSYEGEITSDVTLQLTCTACHQPDDSGLYMLPIRFERHCQACHPMGKQHDQPVPHGSRAIDFIARVAAQIAIDPPKPQAPPGSPGSPTGGRAGPGRGGPPRRSGPPARGGNRQNDEDQTQTIALDKLNEQIADQAVALGKDILITAKCMQCHGPVKSPADIIDPDISDRWMTRGRFGHQAHRFVRCISCHPQAAYDAPLTNSYPHEDDPRSVAASLSWTQHTRDVMLPSIDACRQCHSDNARRTSGGAARHDCVMCHVYHGRESDAVTRHALPANPTSISGLLRRMEE
jgi:predicted CXXCH cytochrome family protein